jgi:DNA-binding CsgD family transcriptional regulator
VRAVTPRPFVRAHRARVWLCSDRLVHLLNGELSIREMAQILYVSPSTVRNHVKSIYRKFGVSSRENAVEQAHAKGLI